MDLVARKDAIRRTMLARRSRLSPAEREAHGRAVADRLFALPEVERARSVLAFASFGSEVPTDPILERALARGTRVMLPYVAPSGDLEMAAIASLDDLAPGYRGIREPRERVPVSSGAADLAIVPGVAFDPDGRRLGHGGGFYDRFLARLPRAAPRIGVCFDLQVVAQVPASERDERVDLVVTEERVIDCRAPRPEP